MREIYPGEEPQSIALWFTPNRVPAGSAPEHIKASWVGVPLPVRESNILDTDRTVMGYQLVGSVMDPTDIKLVDPRSTVKVSTEDAIKALRLFDKHNAADWWTLYFGEHIFDLNLIFQAVEGQLSTVNEILRKFPDLADFDDIEI